MNLNYKNQALKAYQVNAVETQTQGQLIVLLYEGAIKFIETSQCAIDENKVDEAHRNIIKTQNIIKELMITLNMEAGPISKQLFDLYEFMYFQLVQANLKKDKQLLDEVKSLLLELVEAWKTIS